ncbi:MAG: hypothetical protein ACREQL_04375 [Candidatus Binatia bacterium]
MMRIDSFGRSAVFAAVAALAWIPWVVVVGPVVGGSAARTLYLIAVAALYVGALGGRTPRRAAAALGVMLAGVAIAVLSRSATELCLALAVLLGTARSAFHYRAAPARAIATEGALLGGGLVFARHLLSGSPHGIALAIWAFFLVQSCSFLLGGVRTRGGDGRHPDPFEDAHARAMEVLGTPLR